VSASAWDVVAKVISSPDPVALLAVGALAVLVVVRGLMARHASNVRIVVGEPDVRADEKEGDHVQRYLEKHERLRRDMEAGQ